MLTILILFDFIDEGGSISDWLRASSGIPQGSVLVPLLFAIYINDLPAVLSFARVMIYADDTQVYINFFPANIDQAIARTSINAKQLRTGPGKMSCF